MPILGAHMSAGGGCHRAVQRAQACGCDCVQLFTKNNNQWRAKELTEDDAAKFQAALAETKVAHPLVHDSYLINLAAPDDVLWCKSVESFRVELLRADLLGIPYVVTHPGAFTTTSEEAGIARVVQALDEIYGQHTPIKARCLLETTAGQGTALGWKFEHLAEMLMQVKSPEMLGVCVDTCHIFAAGYPLFPRKDYLATWRKFDKIIGLPQIRAFHLNDSKRELGARVDRHEHIGEGRLGLEPFRFLLNDPRFASVPMYLETPKGMRDGVDLDVMNLATLRRLHPASQHVAQAGKALP
jgi:deoxyribonuclease-4